MNGEHDGITRLKLAHFELTFIATTSKYHPGFMDHVIEYQDIHENHYECVYSMFRFGGYLTEKKIVKSAIEQIDLNIELVRVNSGNYMAVRLYLN